MESRIERGFRLISKLAQSRAVATDLDGTLTVDRRSYKMPVSTIEAIRLLQSQGVSVFLVTANGFPITMALAKYIGFDGIVAENGCVVAFPEPLYPLQLKRLCQDNYRWLAREIAQELGDVVVESWQNDFRLCDFAVVTRRRGEPHGPVLERIEELLREKGVADKVRIVSSGYAIHIAPRNCNKLEGLKHLLAQKGLGLEDVVGVGDSALDLDFIRSCGVKVAVANADPELRMEADIITDKPSGEGFSELARLIVDAKKLLEAPGGKNGD